MKKETSSRVSTLAAQVMSKARDSLYVPARDVDFLWDAAKTLAGSAMSQDVTPGQDPPTFLDRLKRERSGLAGRVDKLKSFLDKGAPGVDEGQRQLLGTQLDTMQTYLRILDIRLDRIDQDKPPVASEPELGEPVEIGGHDEDKDGPVPFDA